jgi:glycosyltransferase involved in cell wall biosynthesis
LVIAGKGEERDNLERLVFELNLRDRVIFTGFVWGDDKWSLLKNCDVFVLPSVVEAFGIAVIEAMACEKPVIATNTGPFPEIIRDGETGLLVPLYAPDALADAVIELALNEEKRKEMGERARKDVEERFDINKIAGDYLEIYKELIRKNRRERWLWKS